MIGVPVDRGPRPGPPSARPGLALSEARWQAGRCIVGSGPPVLRRDLSTGGPVYGVPPTIAAQVPSSRALASTGHRADTRTSRASPSSGDGGGCRRGAYPRGPAATERGPRVTFGDGAARMRTPLQGSRGGARPMAKKNPKTKARSRGPSSRAAGRDLNAMGGAGSVARRRKKRSGPTAAEAIAALRRGQARARKLGLDKLSNDEIDKLVRKARKRIRRETRS